MEYGKIKCSCLKKMMTRVTKLLSRHGSGLNTKTLSWYFYDYGWNTVFLILQYPNVFLLLFVIYISVRIYQYEEESGMLSLICSARCGWPKLFRIKILATVLLAFFSGLLFSEEEFLVFLVRGYLANRFIPIGSIPCFLKHQ